MLFFFDLLECSFVRHSLQEDVLYTIPFLCTTTQETLSLSRNVHLFSHPL